jgi:tetratricopeptide (TPR) repeat protein
VSWAVATSSRSTAEKQLALINEAAALISNGIYIRAVPLLEEAAGYDAAYTRAAENLLKRAYLALMDNRGFSRRYTTLLEKQMNRRDAESYMFLEAANYYLSNSKTSEALSVLRNGLERTNDENLLTLYERTRYIFTVNRAAYEDVTAIFNNTVQVKSDGKWGIAHADGFLIIPCQYDKISTFNKDRAVVRSGNSIFAVDIDNNRIAVSHEAVFNFGNYTESRMPLLIEGRWHRATGEFETGEKAFDDIGAYSGGYAAAKYNGKWGVIDISDNWLIPAEFDEIIKDELGRCFAQGTVFVRQGGVIFMLIGGGLLETAFEDARPFADEGYAAVKKNGKWGFINTNGEEVIPFIFDDALSFGQHLAAVKTGEYWGYINVLGNIVIEATFLNAKSFSGGSAPVLTDRGWQFITLLEYSTRGGLNGLS